MSLSDKCLSIIILGVISLSCPHKVHHLPKIYGSVRNKPKGGGCRSTKILKRGRELITNIDHIFPERSLHKQMAALCCSANVPCHNSAWFSSSISFILESHPLIWHWETFPLALTPYQSHQRHATTMRAAPVLITASADKMKNKAVASFILISNPGWHKQVHGDDTNKLEEKERVTGRAITLRRVEEEWHSIWSCQHSSLSLSLTLHTNTHTHLMSAKEPGEQGEVAVKSISSWEKRLIILARQSIWEDLGTDGERNAWISATSLFSAVVFLLTSLSKVSLDVFPLFLRGFTLIMADRQQGFPVDDSVSNVECAYRHNVLLWQWCMYPVFRCCICL